MYSYCLFCETQRCKIIKLFIEKTVGYKVIQPKVIQLKWKQGVAEKVSHDWLPGYLFIYTDHPITPYFPVEGIIRCLHNKEQLEGTDRDFAEALRTNHGTLDTVKLTQIGDRCTIDDPAWQGLHGTVIRMDRGRKRCQVEFNFDNKTHTVWVGYEIVNVIESETQNKQVTEAVMQETDE